jgi:alpha-L-arabinofuranosidase
MFVGTAWAVALSAAPLDAQTVTASVDVTSTIAVMPAYGMGIHTSVYDNSLRASGTPVYELLDVLLEDAGVDVLRYPGGGYADVFHFSVSRSGGGLTGFGLSPWWGEPDNYGYMGPQTDFGNFVRLLDQTNSKTVITVNTGSAIQYSGPSRLGVPSHNGQPQEAAAWVAYANAQAGIYGTVDDVALGVDAEGNDWKTAGYWARLRASTPAEFQAWAQADGVYDPRNQFLAIDRDEPVGIEYWEIGNETFGTGYYGGGTGYALNYAVPYDGTNRDGHPDLSPAAYGRQVNEFQAAMKAVDPDIKVGAVLNTPPNDYNWGPDWNDQVLAQAADNVDFVIVHWYPGGGSTTILNAPRTTIPQMIHGTTAGVDVGTAAGVRDSIATWRTDGNPNALEIFVTETDGGGFNQRVDGLFTADMYITFFENGVSNVDYLELHNGQFLEEASNAPNFAYYGMKSVSLLADAGDKLLATTTSESDVRIHAALEDDGTVAVLVLNMNNSSRTVDVTINGGQLSEFGLVFESDGDSPLPRSAREDLGNWFSTNIAGRTLQVFLIPALPVQVPEPASGWLIFTAAVGLLCQRRKHQ